MTGRFAATMRRMLLAAASAGVLAGIGGCSSVPDAVNPVSWYRGARDAISGDEKKPDPNAPAAATGQAVPNADKPYPSLSTVPEKPESPSTAAERAEAARTLAADRERARYSDEEIRRQTDDQGSRPRRPAPPRQADTAAAQPDRAPPPPASPSTVPAPSMAAAPQPPEAAPSPPPQAAAPRPAPARNPPARLSPEAPAPSAAPPPPPSILSQAPPQPAAPPAAASSPVKRGASTEVPIVFGPPPTDIAIAMPGAPRQAVSGQPTAESVSPAAIAEGRAPRYDSRIPSRVPFVVEKTPAPTGMRVATVYFASGSSALGADDVTAIRNAVEAFRTQGGSIHVVGHASSRTRNMNAMRHEMANFAISLDRANAVAREIIRLGVDPSAVRVSAVSDTEPVEDEDMPAREAHNRRAEILIEN